MNRITIIALSAFVIAGCATTTPDPVTAEDPRLAIRCREGDTACMAQVPEISLWCIAEESVARVPCIPGAPCPEDVVLVEEKPMIFPCGLMKGPSADLGIRGWRLGLARLVQLVWFW